MECLDCQSDIGEPGWGFINCSQCGSRHRNHAETGLTLQPLPRQPMQKVETVGEFVRVGNKVEWRESVKTLPLSYGLEFLGTHCAGCGCELSTLTAITCRADRGMTLIHVPYFYQENDTSPQTVHFNHIVVKRETTCWCCVGCSLKPGYRLYFSKGMDVPQENDNRGKPKGFNTRVTQGKRGRRV